MQWNDYGQIDFLLAAAYAVGYFAADVQCGRYYRGGQVSGSQALAAVGSTSALINVFTNLFIGISLGANVLTARFYAAGVRKRYLRPYIPR